jgi:hypothetical protein
MRLIRLLPFPVNSIVLHTPIILILQDPYSKPLLILLELIQILDNLYWNMRSEKCFSLLQEYYEHLRTMRDILIKNSSRDPFRQNLTVSSNLCYYVQKQIPLLNLLLMNKSIVFLSFLNKGSTVIFCYLFSSALLISLNFPFICVLSYFCLLGHSFASLIQNIA